MFFIIVLSSLIELLESADNNYVQIIIVFQLTFSQFSSENSLFVIFFAR